MKTSEPPSIVVGFWFLESFSVLRIVLKGTLNGDFINDVAHIAVLPVFLVCNKTCYAVSNSLTPLLLCV